MNMYRNPPPAPVSHLSQPKSQRQLSPIGAERRPKENYYHDLDTESARFSNQERKSRQSRRSRLSRYEDFSGNSSIHSAARRDKAAILGIPGQVGSIPRGSVPMDGFI